MVNQNFLALCKEREQDVFDLLKHYSVFQSQGLHCLVSAFIPSKIDTLSPTDLTKIPTDYSNYFENFDPLRATIKDGLRIVPQIESFPWLLFSGDFSCYWACRNVSRGKEIYQGVLDDIRDGVLGLSLYYRVNKLCQEKVLFFVDVPDTEGYSISSLYGGSTLSVISLKHVFCQREIDANASKTDLLNQISSLICDVHSKIPLPESVLNATLARLKRTQLLIK
jgi:hypothetical protein